MNNLNIYTDAGFKDGVSTHHWRVIDERGKVIKRRTFKGYELDPHTAELQTIDSVLKWLNKKNFRGVTINCDRLPLVNILNTPSEKKDILYLQFSMKGLNTNIKWVSRTTKQIILADYYCGELMETILNRKEYQQVLA